MTQAAPSNDATHVTGHDVAARAVQLLPHCVYIGSAVRIAAAELGFQFAPGQEERIIETTYRLAGNGPVPFGC